MALHRCIVSVVGDAHLISKVYFPRLILPLAGTVSGIVDFSISFLLLGGRMAWYGIAVTWRILAVPPFLLLALLTAFAVGLWLSALNVRYRDVGYTVPFLIQIWMFLSPVVYPVSMIPEKYRLLYSLNPMAGVIEGFRWALLGKASPDFSVMAVSAVVEGGPLGVFWFGVPRYIIREILVQQIRILKGLLSFDREKLFGARWRFNYLLGQAIEARIMRAETADLSLSQTTIR